MTLIVIHREIGGEHDTNSEYDLLQWIAVLKKKEDL
jgi:hypothetical protein